jgi:hypothetical protein
MTDQRIPSEIQEQADQAAEFLQTNFLYRSGSVARKRIGY